MTAGRSASSEQSPPRAVSPGRPPASTLAARWRHIIAVAAEEFVTHGYAEANIARIAREAGVSKKTIYARYPSKDELLIAAAGDLAARSHEAITAAMATSGGDPERALTAFGTQIARGWTSPAEVGLYRLIVAEAIRFPQLAAVYRDVMERFGATLASYLREQCALGNLSIPDPEAAARQFGMLAYGGVREKVLLGETVTDEEIGAVVQRAVQVFLVGYSSSRRCDSSTARSSID
ncbi:TetR/AcrR family transcriptional regulator [Nocardia lijiangensis]|uniref:TetR/AcrR family transcriptional regulator n=1 Tax=Nocardia lijiangensis TaxID=299618 RepID=UPI0013903BB0|nr:TetR/AcrR family transcriptional regulator [Nocardia lijiangensis]